MLTRAIEAMPRNNNTTMARQPRRRHGLVLSIIIKGCNGFASACFSAWTYIGLI